MKAQSMSQSDEYKRNEIQDDIMLYEHELDNLDKSIEYQIISLITNPYIQSQFKNLQLNIDSQAQSLPNFKVPKNQLNKNFEFEAGKQNSSTELQNQSPQNQPKSQENDQQQIQTIKSSQIQQLEYQESIQNLQNQYLNSQEEHKSQNQSILNLQIENSNSQKDHKQNQNIENALNQQPISEMEHKQENQSILYPQNQLLQSQEGQKYQDQSIQYTQNKYLKSQLDTEKQQQGIQRSQNQQFKSQEGHKQQYQDSQNPQNQQLKSQKNHNQQYQSIENTNQQLISQQQQNQYINNSNNQDKQSQQILDRKKTDFSLNQQNQTLVQDQTMKTIDKQQQQEVQYYVYEDLKNFLGILTDVTETIKFFDGTQDAAYVPVAINRFILQCNLSNGIHFDCQHNFQSDYQKKLYLEEKQNALKILKESVVKMQIPKNYKINECITRYEQTLGNNTELKTIQPLQVQVEHKAEFNQATLTKVIGGMQQVDKQLLDVSKGIYQKPEKEDLYKNLNERKLIAQQKLAQVYPQVAKQNKQKINQNKQYLYDNIK